jgi:hypothetical protein
MTEKSEVCFVSNTTVRITNLYYDVYENQFIINNDTEQNLQYIRWHGRNNPTEVGKPIIYKQIHYNSLDETNNTNIVSITLGKNDTDTVFLARRYSPHNFGHLLCETAVPIEYIFNSQGINQSDRAVIFDDSSWDGFVDENPNEHMNPENTIFWFESEGNCLVRRKQCDIQSDRCLKPLADTVIFGFKRYIQMYNYTSRYIKINNPVLFGIGYVSPWIRWWNDSSISHAIDTLNTKIYSTYSCNNENTIQNTVTFVVKQGRRQVLNWEEVGIELKRYADNNNLLYEQINLDEVSFETQLEIMARTKTLFTNGGAASFCSLFLSKSSKVVYFPLLNCPMETELYRHLQRFELIEYEHYDPEWKENIMREDGSFTVSISKLQNLMANI